MPVSFSNGTSGCFSGQYWGHFSSQINSIELPPRLPGVAAEGGEDSGYDASRSSPGSSVLGRLGGGGGGGGARKQGGDSIAKISARVEFLLDSTAKTVPF